MTPQKRWCGSVPITCDCCDGSFHNHKFVDGKTSMGPWAMMCSGCHKTMGCGLGVNKGQEYTQANGIWIKTGG